MPLFLTCKVRPSSFDSGLAKLLVLSTTMAEVNSRRLEPRDVRAIFESLHEGKPAPPNLKFQIVPVGPNGLRLSPPSHEFPGTIDEANVAMSGDTRKANLI